MSVTGGPQFDLKCYEQCHNVPLQRTRGRTRAGLVYLLVVAAISAQEAPAAGNAHGVKSASEASKTARDTSRQVSAGSSVGPAVFACGHCDSGVVAGRAYRLMTGSHCPTTTNGAQ